MLPTINWEEFIFTSHPNCRSYSTREPIRSNFVFHLSHLEASKLQEDQSMCQNVKQHNHLTVKRFVDSSLLFLTRHQTWPNWCGRRRLLLLRVLCTTIKLVVLCDRKGGYDGVYVMPHKYSLAEPAFNCVLSWSGSNHSTMLPGSPIICVVSSHIPQTR